MSFFKIKAVPANDGSNLFCNCCLVHEDIIVGDYEQKVLAATLKMSFKDLLLKLDNYELICVNDDIEEVFKNLATDINNSCLPTFVESFDGDFGIFGNVNNKESLIIKKWGEVDLIKIEISKKDYAALVLDALSKITNGFKS